MKLRRKHGNDPRTWQLIASTLFQDPPRSVKLPGILDRCTARKPACDERWRVPYHGTRFHLCTREADYECDFRDRDWLPSPVPIVIPAKRESTYDGGDILDEMVRFLSSRVCKYSLEVGEVGCTARAMRGKGDWAQVDYYASSHVEDDWRAVTRSRAQMRLYERVSCEWEIWRKAIDDDTTETT